MCIPYWCNAVAIYHWSILRHRLLIRQSFSCTVAFCPSSGFGPYFTSPFFSAFLVLPLFFFVCQTIFRRVMLFLVYANLSVRARRQRKPSTSSGPPPADPSRPTATVSFYRMSKARLCPLPQWTGPREGGTSNSNFILCQKSGATR